MSLLEKLESLSRSTMRIAWDSVFAIQNTDVFDMMFLLSCFVFLLRIRFHFELIFYVRLARDSLGEHYDAGLFPVAFDRAAQRNLAVHGDDFDIPGGHRVIVCLAHQA